MTMLDETTATDQDLGAIASADWPSRRMPVKRTSGASPILINRSVLNEIHAHGRSAEDIEVCGVLIGNVYTDAGRAFVHIEGCIRGNHATSKTAQVTFTAETWTHIQSVLDNDHPDQRILGWYHTHPAYGVFLSDMDVFIHKNFFSLPWHTAFVYDPQANEEGLFAWRTGNLASEPFIIYEDCDRDESPATIAKSPERPETPTAAPGTVMELSARVQLLEQRQKWLLAGLALAALIAITWPLLIAALVPALKRDVSASESISLPPEVKHLRNLSS